MVVDKNMKKLRKIVFIILISFFIINFISITVKAEGEGYYIKNMNVNIEVNDKRQFFITETIDVYFNEGSHGIKRDIKLSSDLEYCTISDISVEGAPFKLSNSKYNAELKIGSEDELISGNKRYVIKYTLNYYDDEQKEGDYIYLNVSPEWDTRMEKFKTELSYPKEGKLEEVNLTHGRYGSTGNYLSKYSLEDNKIIIESTDVINSGNIITVKAKLNNGTFKNAKVEIPPYFINKDIMDIKVTKEKEYFIEIIVTGEEFKDGREYINLWDEYSRDIVSDIKINSSEIKLSDNNPYIYIPEKPGNYNFNVSYKVRPNLNAELKVMLKSDSREYRIKELKSNITSEVPILGNRVTFIEKGGNKGKERYTLEADSNTLYFKALNEVYPDEEIYIKLGSDNNLFLR